MADSEKFALAQEFSQKIEEFNELVAKVEHMEHIVFLDWDCENHCYTRMQNYAQMMMNEYKPF